MIDLTRLNGTHFTLNCDLIKYAEATPDTTLTLIGGEKLIVREPLGELKRSVMAYRGAVLRVAWPEGTVAPVPVTHDVAPMDVHVLPQDHAESSHGAGEDLYQRA